MFYRRNHIVLGRCRRCGGEVVNKGITVECNNCGTIFMVLVKESKK